MPYALRLAADSRVLASYYSRPEQPDGSPGTGFVWCSPEQYTQSLTMTRPYWSDGQLVDLGPVTPAEQDAAEVARQAAKPAALKTAENDYLGFCDQLGLTGPATTAQITQVLLAMKAQGLVAEALESASRALALIHEVEVQGGRFSDIPAVPHEV